MVIEYGCYERDGKVYDLLITTEDGREIALKDRELDELVKELAYHDLCMSQDACENCNMCDSCDRVDPDDFISEDTIAEWVDNNVKYMAEEVLEKMQDFRDEITDTLLNYARDNVCFLRHRI